MWEKGKINKMRTSIRVASKLKNTSSKSTTTHIVRSNIEKKFME